MTRVLVTGAGGFVGRAAVPVLQDAGCEVVPARTDLLAPDGPRAAVAQAEATHLLHLAWETEHGAYWDSPDNERWLTASLELLAQFARAGGERAVTVGTCAEYDWTSGGVLAEDAPCAPATAYGRAKLERKGLDAVVVNDIGEPGIGFDSAENAVTIVTADGERHVSRRAKSEVAAAVLDAALSRRSASERKVRP